MNQSAVNILLSQKPGELILQALRMLFEQDGHLFWYDANERSITHRFAMHLQTVFPEWHVDCEYNRDGIEPKRLQHLGLYPNAEDTDAKTVYPDIVAHIRGTSTNYLVMEIKKSTNPTDHGIDLAKLRGYRKELGYTFALFLELVAAADPDIKSVEWA